LNKPLEEDHFNAILNTVTLDDGPAPVVDLAIVSEDAKTLGIEIQIGRNRIIRRLFEHLKYDVVKLDRVSFAGLTKKDLPRGKWKFLSQKELIKLKRFI